MRIPARPLGVKHLVREQAGHRCIRCGHPYAGGGEWTACDERCRHWGPRLVDGVTPPPDKQPVDSAILVRAGHEVLAAWRILTVHHLRQGADAKRDLRWWNLVAVCQRCHLSVQTRVMMERVWPWPHSEWFRPYAAGWYAWTYLGEDLTRAETLARMDELLALEAMTS
jgi:5-methylcytosine-specific restriction endonuclease McrA